MLKTFATAALALSFAAAFAADYTPSSAALQALVFVDFGGGGSFVSNTPSGTGALVTVNFDPNSNGTGNPGFTRVAIQKTNFEQDLTGYTTFSIVLNDISNVTGVKTFIQTGPSYTFYESAFTNLTANTPTTVTLSLAGVTNLSAVRQFGMQLFGPAGAVQGAQVLISPVAPVPEPASLGLLGLGVAYIAFRRRS